jgi:hypothetical protein
MLKLGSVFLITRSTASSSQRRHISSVIMGPLDQHASYCSLFPKESRCIAWSTSINGQVSEWRVASSGQREAGNEHEKRVSQQ